MVSPVGFARRGLTWNRRVAPVVQVVNLQISKSGDAFTLNFGVLDPNVHLLCWGEPPKAHVDEARCTVRARLGELMDHRDRWWSDSSSEALDEIERALTHYGLPFLEAHLSSSAMEQYLTPLTIKKSYPEAIYWAILKTRNGGGAAACAALFELQQRTSGPWREKIESIRTRLDCTHTEPSNGTTPAPAASGTAT